MTRWIYIHTYYIYTSSHWYILSVKRKTQDALVQKKLEKRQRLHWNNWSKVYLPHFCNESHVESTQIWAKPEWWYIHSFNRLNNRFPSRPRVCLQIEVISPLPWSIVADKLLCRLDIIGFEIQEYAVDIAIFNSFEENLINGIRETTSSSEHHRDKIV